VDTSDFQMFLEESLSGVSCFQVGSTMEPTLDPRLADLLLLISRLPARPRHTFRLQTNGILLHRHDHVKMRDAGLTILTVSDTLDPSVLKRLRGGTSLSKVKLNMTQFHKTCPHISIAFVITVTSINIDTVDDLVRSVLDLGVTAFNLRRLFYHPSSRIVDHSQMPALLVSHEEFSEMSAQVQAKYGSLARFML